MASIAVVIPSYNHARYIGAALESVVIQSLAPDRIVVVDDGSTDHSVEVIRAFTDPRLELICQENAGAHAALNRAIAACGAVDYVAILNSDDLFEPERFQRCVSFLENNRGFDVVCTALRLIDSDGNFVPADHPNARRLAAVWADPARDPAEWLGVANFAKTTSNFVIRTEYARAHPFRDYRYVHDYFFAIVAAVEGKFAVLPEPLLRYRTHGDNSIKRDGAANVTREVLRMTFDVTSELAPGLAQSTAVRAAFTRFFRQLSENQSDFRVELFLAGAARFFSELDAEVFTRFYAELTESTHPELTARPGDAIRRGVEQARLDAFRQAAARSRWLSLGRVFGLAPDIFSAREKKPGRELARLQKELKHSRWTRLGHRLGLVAEFLQ